MKLTLDEGEVAQPRSIASWINESVVKELGDLPKITRLSLEDMMFPHRRRAREFATAAEWLTYYLAAGADGGQALSDVLGNGLERGYDGPMLAKLVDMMGIEVEDRHGECFLKLPLDHPYRLGEDE